MGRITIKSNEDPADKPLTSTMEDYLEAIFDLDKDKKVIRVSYPSLESRYIHAQELHMPQVASSLNP